MFDLGAEVILSKFKMGEHSAKTTKKSTMVVETHTTYNREVKEGDLKLMFTFLTLTMIIKDYTIN